ncbi:MAG: hypothetical protein HRT65_10135 [Flavobacteriaceae bacterium]|nr:hypothetical protein [Flavobacteriaceae bacterium]
MERTNFNMYLFKALDAYPYELEEAIEALNYALSYDAKNVKALCMMGTIYAEQLGEYEAAKACFEEALEHDLESPYIYPDYIAVLILNEDLTQAQKVLEFALTVKGMDKAVLYNLQSWLFEKWRQYKMAIRAMEEVKAFSYNSDYQTYAENEIVRIKKKLSKSKTNKKKGGTR